MWFLRINFQKDFILFGYSQIHEIYPQLEYIYSYCGIVVSSSEVVDIEPTLTLLLTENR